MQRGDVRYIDLDLTRLAEANKRRPAVVVSNDAANQAAQRLGRGVITVVPITSSTERVYPFQVLLPTKASGLKQPSKAQAEQVRAVDVARVGELVKRLPARVMAEIDEALRLHLAL